LLSIIVSFVAATEDELDAAEAAVEGDGLPMAPI